MMVGAPGKWGSTTGVCEGVARGVEEAGKLIVLVVRGLSVVEGILGSWFKQVRDVREDRGGVGVVG